MIHRICLILGLLIPGLHAQALYKDIHPSAAGSAFATSVCTLGDVDGDGVLDFAVSAPTFYPGLTSTLRVYSGRYRVLLYEVQPAAGVASTDFGRGITSVGDWSGDGIEDLALTSAGTTAQPSAYAVLVVSGVDGSTITSIPGVNNGSGFGKSLARLPDRDGDGKSELLVGAPDDDTAGLDHGAAYVVSSLTGLVTVTHPGLASQGHFGICVADCGDVDGDGSVDYAVGTSGFSAEFITVYSGVTDAQIRTLGSGGFGGVGQRIVGLGDLNGDGFGEVLSSAPLQLSGVNSYGKVFIYSGANGNVVHTDSGVGDTGHNNIGYAIGSAGDYDGDGINDYMYNASGIDFSATSTVVIRSGATFQEIVRLPAITTSSVTKIAQRLGDLDGDGFDDFFLGDADLNNSFGLGRVVRGHTAPFESYHGSNAALPEALTLTWVNDPPTGGIGAPPKTTGVLLGTGTTPGAIGLVAASFAPADLNYFGLPILVSYDAPNLAVTGLLGANAAGQFAIGGLDRKNPVLAGLPIYIQFYEVSPVIGASNGLRIAYAP